MKTVLFNPALVDPMVVSKRRALVIALVLLFTGPAVMLMADLHWRSGYDLWKFIHLALFAILFSLVAWGAGQALLGLVVRRRGGDPYSILRSVDFENDRDALRVRVAVVMPICNEEVKRVMEGFRTAYESVAATGQLPECDFFLLSDSNNPNNWIAEEASWLAMVQRLGAHGRIFYRKRRVGINKKAGNVADFCRRWGSHYRYMVVLDADSIMSGAAIVKLVRMMEQNRRVGLIQGVPTLVNGETILARLQQFASRLYGPIFASGLNYWQLSEANYWGHNAIIRLAPFIRHCSLPDLPGDGPFGGRILSHDYVEAALMRRAGWQVWLATDLDGNYEECPANVIDLAKRDRRWLQGNLQHARLIGARGFHVVSRVHFTMGILSYVASPLWLSFLVLSVLIAWRKKHGPPAPATLASLGDLFHWSYQTQALCLFAFTTGLLFLPKVFALVDLRGKREEIKAFGGWPRLLSGIGLETITFTLLAPILMLFHSKFVILTLCRQSVSWGAQRRGRDGASAWKEAFSEHLGHTLLGVAGTVVMLGIDPILAAWMSPILAGLLFSIPLSFITGSLPIGAALRKRGLFLIPEESTPPKEVLQINENLAAQQQQQQQRGGAIPSALAADYGLLQATLDPYVNAAHLAMLREKDDVSVTTGIHFAELREKLLRGGPEAVSSQEKLSLLMDPESMNALHEEVWSSPASDLAPWWREALSHYNLLGPVPETAFSR